jgi:hypothetical protein
MIMMDVSLVIIEDQFQKVILCYYNRERGKGLMNK